jgi:hypothetical protein
MNQWPPLLLLTKLHLLLVPGLRWLMLLLLRLHLLEWSHTSAVPVMVQVKQQRWRPRHLDACSSGLAPADRVLRPHWCKVR